MKVAKQTGFAGLLIIVVACWVLLPLWTLAQSSSPDVGLVTGFSGEVTCTGDKPTIVLAFMKIRLGDRFTVPEGGVLQLLYFEEGRQEVWKGPLALIVEQKESRADGLYQGAPPEVKYLPPKATRRMATTSLPLPGSSFQTSGVIQTMAPVRVAEKRLPVTAKAARLPGRELPDAPAAAMVPEGLSEQAPTPAARLDPGELKAARNLYSDMRKTASPDDLTPEVYYLGVLADHKQYRQMKQIVNALLKKKPKDPTLLDWKAWIDRQSAKNPRGAAMPEKKG